MLQNLLDSDLLRVQFEEQEQNWLKIKICNKTASKFISDVKESVFKHESINWCS